MAHYEVNVSNVGTVYSGDKLGEAIKAFREYQQLSEDHVGRAGDEDVALFADGVLEREHVGLLSRGER